MKKVTALSILILSFFTQLAFSNAYYVRSNVGSPWGQTNYEEDMDAVFGSGAWVAARYETIDANILFSSGNNFIYMEGSDRNANEMEAFITANKTKMEDWVFNGGTLFLNAAPNEGSGMNFGFGVTLIYSDSSGTSTAADPNHEIFNGPFGITGSTFTGNSFGHATVIGTDLNPLIVDNSHGRFVLAEKTHGRGVAFFGGMTSRNFHSPKPQVTYLHRNIRMYQATIKGSILSYNRQLIMNPGDNTNVQILLNNRDVFAINAVIKYSSDTLNITGPADLQVAAEDSELISVNVATSLSAEGTHMAEIEFDIDQGEKLTAEIVVDIVNFQQLTPDTSFNSYSPDLSKDGNLIVLTSNADLASTAKPASAKDIFIYNRTTKIYQQLTSNPAGKTCNSAVISGAGSYVAAFCNSSLDGSKPNSDGSYELYYFDIMLNTVTQVNTNSNAVMNNASRQIAINNEGNLVYFSSNSNLDAEISNTDGSSEVFVFNRDKSKVHQVSNFNYSSNDVKSISTDYEGKRFVVSSRGNPLGQNSRQNWRAFGGTLNKGITHQITGNNSTKHTEGVVISGNGEFITLQSTDNLDTDFDAYNKNQIFRAEFEGRNFKQITLSSISDSYDPAISNNGNRIIFRSNASLAGANNASNSEVFMYVHKQNRLRAMTEVNQNKSALLPRISADGSTIVFQGDGDWITGDNPGSENQIFFQSNLGSEAVTRYEDPSIQYAKKAYLSSSEVDEEAKNEIIMESVGYVSWLFISMLSLLAFRKRKEIIKV
jgi:hypothetical protein